MTKNQQCHPAIRTVLLEGPDFHLLHKLADLLGPVRPKKVVVVVVIVVIVVIVVVDAFILFVSGT